MRAANLFVSLPRHPLRRALVVIAGVVLMALLVVTGLAVIAAVVVATAVAMVVRRWLHRGPSPSHADPGVIEGEFTVVAPRPPVSLPHPE